MDTTDRPPPVPPLKTAPSGVHNRQIPSLAHLFQSSKYRTKRKPNITFYSIVLIEMLMIFITLCVNRSSFFLLLCCLSVIGATMSEYNTMHSVDVRSSLRESALVAGEMTTTTSPSMMSNQNCISICQCKWKNGKETANCDHRSLMTIPNGLSSTTQVIDLSGNVLTQLPPMIFIQRGLINLQRIYLSNCHLVEISAESFVKLSNLIELDLSNNSLSTIPSRSLAECPSLRRLSLAGNRIREIKSRSFLPLTNLNWLDLSRNVIYHLDTDAFIGLRSLQVLKLQSNHLQTIPSAQSFIQFLSVRVSLELHDNQWRCDCHLKPFRDWIQINTIPMTIKPICMMPQRLQGQTWDLVSTDEFSCPPTIHTVNTHFYKHIGNNVTITCSVSGFPPPRIYWLFESSGGQQTLPEHESNPDDDDVDTGDDQLSLTTMDPSSKTSILLPEFRFDDRNHDHHPRQMLPSPRYSIVQEREQMGAMASKLTVHSLQPIDTQRITCLANNVGGTAMKNFTLIVSTQEPFSSSRSMDLLVSEFMLIVVAICILLFMLIIFLFVVIFRRKSSTGAGSTAVCDSSQPPEPTRIDLEGTNISDMESEYRNVLKQPLPPSSTIINGANGPLMSNGDLVNQQHHHQHYLAPATYHQHLNGGITALAPPSSGGLLMVNASTIDPTLFTVAQAGNNLSNDPSISTDLSSQSTTATSMNGNGNGPTVSPSQNSHQMDVEQPQPQPVFYSTSGPFESSYGSSQQHANHHQSDILLSSNGYYLTTATATNTTSQYPLLNSGPLQYTTQQDPNLIYGTTRIAPTRMIPSKVNKVKFADQQQSTLHHDSSLESNPGSNHSSSSTSSSSIMSNAYTIATLRRGHHKPADQICINKPLGTNHRNVSSYPDGLRLVESSVDSGEPIRITNMNEPNKGERQHSPLDETEEDDYYRNMKQ